MSLCDNLEASLARSQADGERLMEVIMGSKDPGESKAMIARTSKKLEYVKSQSITEDKASF